MTFPLAATPVPPSALSMSGRGSRRTFARSSGRALFFRVSPSPVRSVAHGSWRMARKIVDALAMSISDTADRMIRETMIHARVKMPEARKIVARECGVTPGALEGLKRGRIRHVEWIEGRIREAFVRRIELEISRLTHELEVARRAAVRPDETAIGEAETALAHARDAIKRASGRR